MCMGEMTHATLAENDELNAPADDRVRPDADPVVDVRWSRKCCDSNGGAVEYDPLPGDDDTTHDPRTNETNVAPAWAEVDA